MDALAWFGALAGFGGIRGFTGQRGRGSAPSAALGALRTEPPPRVPGMRLVQCQLLTLGGCGRLVCRNCFATTTNMCGPYVSNNECVVFGTANKNNFLR